MNSIQRLFHKKKKLVIGLMSGTSVDGIDAALLEVEGSGMKTKFHQLAFAAVPYPNGFKDFLLKNSDPQTARLDDIARLNFLIGEFFADAGRRVVLKAGKRLSSIDLIGSHGQTVCHLPRPRQMFGKKITATFQLGDPAVIAKRTGVITVGDFRVADVAVGGSGAPLVPYVDYLLFRSGTKNRAVLNLGGIANITLLPHRCSLKDVRAFDTGPANIVVDGLMKHFFGKPFDSDGHVARRGKILPQLLQWMANHPYLRRPPPKSTGREEFGEAFVRKVVRRPRGKRREDIVATATEFTALSVYDGIVRFARRKLTIDELIVSGGGVHNTYLMNALQRYFTGTKTKTVERFGFSSDAKEAICFALLANETIAGNPANLPGTTGAKHPTVLGKICLP